MQKTCLIFQRFINFVGKTFATPTTAMATAVPLIWESDGQTIWCSPCSREDRQKPADSLCMDCQEYFCDLCTRSHQTFTALKDHRLEKCHIEVNEVNEPLNLAVRQPSEDDHPLMDLAADATVQPNPKLADFEKKLQQKLKQTGQNKSCPSKGQSEKSYAITQCPLHDGENLTVYCQDHMRVGCHVCAAISHRQCKTVTFLPEASAGFANSQAKKNYIDDITNTLKNLQNTKTARTRDMQTLSERSSNVISNIQKYKDSLINRLEKIAAESIKTVVCQTEALNEKIQDDMNQCDTMVSEIKDLQNAFSLHDEENDLLLFIEANHGRETLNKGKELSKVTSAGIGKESIRYTIGNSLKTYLTSLSVFGRIEINSDNPCLDKLSVIQYKKNTFDSQIELEMSNRALGIRDCCELSTKYSAFILSQRINDILVVQENSGKAKEFYPLSGRAFGICHTGPLDMAVTVNQEQAGEVQLFSVKNGIRYYFMDPLKKVLKFNHPVYGIAYHEENLFIGEQRQVNVYDMKGKILYKIYEHGVPKHITISPDGNLVYIADFFAGVVVITRAGEIKQVLNDKYLNGIHGVSVDVIGNVYASGYISSSVVKFDAQGKRRGVYITKSDLFKHPVQVCNKRNGQLVMAPGSISMDQP